MPRGKGDGRAGSAHGCRRERRVGRRVCNPCVADLGREIVADVVVQLLGLLGLLAVSLHVDRCLPSPIQIRKRLAWFGNGREVGRALVALKGPFLLLVLIRPILLVLSKYCLVPSN